MPVAIEIVLTIFTLGAFASFSSIKERFGSFLATLFVMLIVIGNASFWTDRLDFLKPVNLFSNSSKLMGDLNTWLKQDVKPPDHGSQRTITTQASPKYENQGPFPQQNASSQIQAVTDFFNALGRSDGFTASSLLLPQNRGSGELADKEFDKFSGMLKQPVHLEYAKALRVDLVKAKYDYVRQDGVTCNGIAYVTVSKRDNLWLISDINGTRC